MKTFLLPILLTTVALFSFPAINFGQAPTLGTASGFALFTASGAFGNNGATTVTGDIGTNVGAFTGFPPGTLIGLSHVADPQSVTAASDVDAAYSFLTGLTCDSVIGVTLGNGQILPPNIYCIGAISSLNGELVLDAQGDPDALFIFKIDGALSTTTHANISLINSASLCNVYWQINGAFDLGDSSVFSGTLITNGAITLLEASSLLGRGLSRQGAIALNNNVVTIGSSSVASVISASGATSFCAGDSVTLSGNNGGTWSNSATTSSITVYGGGNYYVTNTGGCGDVTSNHIIITVSSAPLASTITAGGSTTFCAGGNVTLAGNSGGTWSNSLTTTSITVSTAGNYFVTNTNACGSITSNLIITTINPLPVASTISAGGAINFCEGDSVILSGNNGGIWSNAATATSITASSGGDYFVTNSNSCGNVTSNHIIITVNPLPVASAISASGATTFCAGGSVTLSGNNSGTWSDGATTASITTNTNNDYFVTNTTNCGSINSNHIIVIVNQETIPSVISASGTTTFCEGDEVILSGNNGGIWSDGTTAADITVSTSGDYYVTNNGFCGSETSNHIIVTVNLQPVASVISTNDATTFCAGNNAVLFGNNGGTWSNGTNTPSLTVSSNGDYFVTNTSLCGSINSNHIIVTVNVAPVIITQPKSKMASDGGSVSFSVTATGTGLTYQWRNGTTDLVDGGNISGATTAILTINPVSISDTSSNYNLVITGVCAPNITSVDASLFVCECIATSIVSFGKGNEKESVTIYPNPFTTSIDIILNDVKEINKCELKMYNALGAEVINTFLSAKVTSIDTNTLSTGVYFFQIIKNNKTVQSGKLIAQ